MGSSERISFFSDWPLSGTFSLWSTQTVRLHRPSPEAPAVWRSKAPETQFALHRARAS